MGIANRIAVTFGPFSIDGGDELEVSHGMDGTWVPIKGVLTPHTTLAAHASNTQTATLKKGAGGTAIAMMTSDSDDTTYGAAFTKGTPRHFVFTGTGKDMEFTKDDALELAITEGGTCNALDASVVVVFEQRGGSGGDR